jgi:hypothetical protein
MSATRPRYLKLVHLLLTLQSESPNAHTTAMAMPASAALLTASAALVTARSSAKCSTLLSSAAMCMPTLCGGSMRSAFV